jgi:hypothetical protein
MLYAEIVYIGLIGFAITFVVLLIAKPKFVTESSPNGLVSQKVRFPVIFLYAILFGGFAGGLALGIQKLYNRKTSKMGFSSWIV